MTGSFSISNHGIALQNGMGGAPRPHHCAKRPLQIEVVQRNDSEEDVHEIHRSMKLCISQRQYTVEGSTLRLWDRYLENNIRSVRLEWRRARLCSKCLQSLDMTSNITREPIDTNTFEGAQHSILIYKLLSATYYEEMDEKDEVTMTQTLYLPSEDLDGLWESLIYDTQVKEELLEFSKMLLKLSNLGVDKRAICNNRLLLFHGEPGTGKTSLCRALAQKLSVHLSGLGKFRQSRLVEINSHCLFSKYFSESGKIVQKLFTGIRDMLEDGETLVILLMDEVESLAMSRSGATNSSEPGDATRVVNALLTQIDQLRAYPNVLVLTTSNLTGVIDPAFVDRADLDIYIGPPSTTARYTMIYQGIQELIRTGMVICNKPLTSPNEIKHVISSQSNIANKGTTLLWRISQQLEGFSGRSIKKLSSMAYACYLTVDPVSMDGFLRALELTVKRKLKEKKVLLGNGQQPPTTNSEMPDTPMVPVDNHLPPINTFPAKGFSLSS